MNILTKHAISILHVSLVCVVALSIASCRGGIGSNNGSGASNTSISDTNTPVSDNTAPASDNNNILGSTSLSLSGVTQATAAEITLKSLDGTLITTSLSDGTATYSATISSGTAYPIIITAIEGTDIVTGAPPDFTQVSVALNSNIATVNINPLSTLIVKTALAMPGGLNAPNLDLARQIILERLNFGLDTTLIPDPITMLINEQNIAYLVKASQIVTETIRRTHTALLVVGTEISQDALTDALAADLSDGVLDGIGNTGTDPLFSATVNVVSGQVLVEALSNNLNVNGAWASDLMDNAIINILPTTTLKTADIPINTAILNQAKTATEAAQAIAPSDALSMIAILIDSLSPGMMPVDIEALLPEDKGKDFEQAITAIVWATPVDIAKVNDAVREAGTELSGDNVIRLAWYQNPDQVLGYIIYYGPTPLSATTIATETSGTFVAIDIEEDLGLSPGDSLCLRLKAFNQAGLSEYSGAACMYI